MILDFFLYGCAVLFAFMSAGALFHLRWANRLPPVAKTGTLEKPVSCSVVVAARDEQARIEATIRHLLAQQGVNLEIIPVDDRSADSTGQILEKLAAEDSRVKPLKVTTLPERWLGKCHACHLGAQRGTGEWILFTDADCWLAPDVLQRALRVAHKENADHITLTPGVSAVTLPARSWHIAFLFSMANWFSGVNRDKPKFFLGMGAFNLVRSSVYRECGGYEALRLTVVDDVKLGLLVRRAGKRTRAFIGGDDTLCHWGETVGGMIQVMEKNYFAAIDYRISVAVAAAFLFPILSVAGLGAVFTGRLSGLAMTLAFLSFTIPAMVISKRLRWKIPEALFVPFIFPALGYAILRSTFLTLKQRGVRWRNTFYPLDLLRKENVQP